MEGWRLPRGEIKASDLSEVDLWHYFNILFSTRSKNQSSYKFVFLRALFENVYNANAELSLSFDQLFGTFTRVYWNMVVKHNLRQCDRSHEHSAVEDVLRTVKARHSIPSEVAFDSLPGGIQADTIARVKVKAKRYVVGAVYGDTEGTIYGFDLGHEYLRFSQPVYRFIQRHHNVLFRLNNYELIKYLYDVNLGRIDGNVASIVENLSKRESLGKYLSLLLKSEANVGCFYCGRGGGAGGTKIRWHVDHFVPWSFVHDDKIWNLVLSCGQCNGKKGDKLAAPVYLEKVLARNLFLQSESSEVVQVEMSGYSPSKLTDLYRFAEVNGFACGWRADA